jgi:N-formylglutamate deformylase
MRLPILLSLPHAGTQVPPEVKEICRLTPQQIYEDGDEGAAGIYALLEGQVEGFVTTDTARAIVDLNRAEDDFRKDGVIKTHTCWDVPVYTRPPQEKEIRDLLDRYYHPYHRRLSAAAGSVRLGLDCHTMAAFGPPVGPDPGSERPPVCLSNADGTCPHVWLRRLAESLEQALGEEVSLNHPFKGGYIVRRHAQEMPWIQIEFSRADFLTPEAKSQALLTALRTWYPTLQESD